MFQKQYELESGEKYNMSPKRQTAKGETQNWIKKKILNKDSKFQRKRRTWRSFLSQWKLWKFSLLTYMIELQ